MGLTLALATPATMAGVVYKWTDRSGAVHLTTTAPPPGAKVLATIRTGDAPPASRGLAPVRDPAPGEAWGDARPAQPEVVMYATARCPYCRQARDFFRSRGIAWREIDIESSAAADREFTSRGGTGVPLIFINQTRVQGFDAQHVAAVLERERARR